MFIELTALSLSYSNRVKKRRKRGKVESSKSASHSGDEDDETEDSEDDDDQENGKSAKLLGLESLMSKYSASSESVKTAGEGARKTSNQVDDDATDDSEDESDKKPQFSRLSFLRLHKPGAEAEPEKTGKKEPPGEKLITVVEDEETEDSEDYDGDGNESEKSSLMLSLLTKKSSSDSPPKVEMPKKVAGGMANGDEDKNTKSTHPQVSGQDANLNSKGDANDKAAAVKTSSNVEMVEIVDSEWEGDNNTKESWSSSLSSRQSGQDLRQNSATGTADSSKRNDHHHSGSKPNSTPSKSDKKPLQCKVCRTMHRSRRILIRHAWKHVDNRDRPCGVCGKQFDSEESIKNHLQAHHTIHRCKICGKSFLLQKCFSGHMDRHKGTDNTYSL